jgi:hypothetical protein
MDNLELKNNKLELKNNIITLTRFINNYNAIGYGKAEVIETKTSLIIKIYNAGFSENEELEREFLKDYPYFKYRVIVDFHPLIYIHLCKFKFEDTDLKELRGTEFYKILNENYLIKLEIE